MNALQNIINDLNNNVEFAERQLKGILGSQNISIDEFYRGVEGNLHYSHTRSAESELCNLIFRHLNTFESYNEKGLKLAYKEWRRNKNILTIEKLEEFKKEAIAKTQKAIEIRKEDHPALPIHA